MDSPCVASGVFASGFRIGLQRLSGNCLCCGAHGLSCAITAWRAGAARTLLSDSGSESTAFERNVDRLGFDMGSIESIVLSHGRWDHSGAMLRALQMIQSGNGGRSVPTYMHPGVDRSRAVKGQDGSIHPMEDVPSAKQLEQHGAVVIHAAEPQLLLNGLFFLSGEIPRVTAFETGMPSHYRQTVDGTGWEPDPLIMDERFVAVAVKGNGVIVFTACSHAGVVNVLAHARK